MNTSMEHIWMEFYTPMKAYIKKHIKKEQDVEDILQIIFLKIHNNSPELSQEFKEPGAN